ncbi:MAG TPA: HAMP domain-containing sensor histidine kinase [Ohtaekwangia sp.]|uniref:sensor histidine kinase n=1 Tax=Ohtaekwangia sp. TaxID=2066019 RepID=UPI002F956FFA
MNVLHPRNWSRYSRRFTGDKEGLRKYKRVILLSQFALFGSVVGVFHALEDLVDGLYFMPMMDFIMAVSIFICYLINESGRHKTARLILLSFLNIYFFIYSSLANHQLGIYLYYFSWVGLAAVVFEVHENFYRFFFIGLSIVLTIILFATNFDAFGKVTFEAVDIERSFIINFVSSILVLVFFIVFMANMNEQTENKLIALASEVKTKNTELEKANRELDRFFYSASHDLKIPLMDIKGAINAALAENKNEEVLAYFEVLKERAQKLDNFLLDIIDYARNSQIGLRLETIDIALLIDDVVRNFAFTKDADKIKFQKDIHLERLVEVDRIRLIVILNNIISNAIKYHSLDKRDPWVNIQAYHKDHKLTLIISDNGQGIDEELLPRIFEMFFRGTNQSKGSGLGLYIVRETVEKMGGDIQVQSELGKGTIFTVTLPVNLSITPVETPKRVTVL